MNIISFITANYVARELGFHMEKGWMQGEDATNAFFRPEETFAARFDALLGEIRALGYTAADVWTAHLHPKWATRRQVSAAREALARHGMRVPTMVGYFGDTEDELRTACRLARELDCTILSGAQGLLKTDRPRLAKVLREEGVRLAVENHPEKDEGELLARMGEGDEDVIGATVDTGWFATQRYDAVEAIAGLKGRLFHIHLKDVKARRKEPTGFAFIDMGHETCRLGAGIVPIERCVKTAVRDGYTGPISFEHEPEDYDPSEDARASLLLLKSMLL